MGDDDLLRYYDGYDEEGRLDRDHCHRVEFLTTLHYLERLLGPGSRILEVGAGPGRYALHFAAQGHTVTARDILPRHVAMLSEKAQAGGLALDVALGDARDLAEFAAESFDAVLCLGPLYHLHALEERRQAVEECLRVLCPGGLLAAAYVNLHGQFLVNYARDAEFLSDEALRDLARGAWPNAALNCFSFTHPREVEELLAGAGLEPVAHVAADGVVYLLRERINGLDEEGFSRWLTYHLQTCEDPWLLGCSVHGLYIGRKPQWTAGSGR